MNKLVHGLSFDTTQKCHKKQLGNSLKKIHFH